MTWYSNAIQLLSTATYSAATAGRGCDVAEYVSGQLVIHITGLSGTNPRVYPSWSLSYNATSPTSGRYVVLRAFATSLRATGLSVLTLPPAFIGKWCRVSLSLGGTGPSAKLGAWFIGKGST